MKINDHLYLVGGGDYGFNLSGRLDANSYVIDTGEGLWMIDAGFDGGEQVVANIVAEGLEPRDITRLFVTHYHADHAGALAYMRKALSPELKIAIHADVADEVRAGDEEDNGLRWAKSFNFYPWSSTSSRATSISSSWAARATAPDASRSPPSTRPATAGATSATS